MKKLKSKVAAKIMKKLRKPMIIALIRDGGITDKQCKAFKKEWNKTIRKAKT